MRTDIYYFSGTGNSLSVARDIADRINGNLISIASVVDKESIKTEADAIGIVFPCYLAQLHGVPLIVERFVRKLENIDSKYVFAVCTCGGLESVNALPALKNLGKAVKSAGGAVAAEFSIKLPMNNLEYPYRFIDQNQDAMFAKSRDKVEMICQRVTHRKRERRRILKSLFNTAMTPLYSVLKNAYIAHLKKVAREPEDTNLKYYELIPLSDRSIYADDKCNGCGTCARVCPAHNIQMAGNKPAWQHRCEMCMACVEWCPNRAIHHWNIAEGKAYHHPSVTIADMLGQSRRA